MRVGDRGCRALSAMAKNTAKLVRRVRNHGMTGEGLRGHVCQARFLQACMAGGAAVHCSNCRQPDLLDVGVEVTLQRIGIAASVNQREVAVLKVSPLTEVILCGGNSKDDHQQQANHAECTDRVTEEGLPS